ncbi:MAG: tyrosine-type recombinase/integrase [Rhodoferax sp.]|nr:tyrosine-type recombinase/integrase [Rhodoferax sp.]
MRDPTPGVGRVFTTGYSGPQAPYPMDGGPGMPRSAGMRRRLLVFGGVFLLCALISLSYTFLRPAVYLASARLQITPPAKLPVPDAVAAVDSTPDFLLESQVLNSRPLLEKVATRLASQGVLKALEGEPVLALQAMLKVAPIEGTNVIELEAKSEQRLLVARLINTTIEVYREQQALAGASSAQTELAQARDEVRVIDNKVAERKRAMEEFRLRANIVSGERDENQALSRVKGLGTSLTAATDREAVAEGRVRALEQAASEGKRAPQAKDNSTVLGIEQRLLQLREEWRALERQFTPQYLDMDANARALKTRISNLEQQAVEERRKSQQTALTEAREELASARATTQRLQQHLADDKQSAQSFSRRFGEFQTLQEELRGLDQMRQSARQRLLALEASELTRKPRLQVLEAAATPESAWRPLYWRDAAISLAASLVLGFLAVWFVEFFDRREPVAATPSTVILAQPWLAPQHGAMPLGHAPGMAPLSAPPGPPQRQQLAAPPPRELDRHELSKLLLSAAPENLPLLICLLSGMTVAELLALRVSHVNDNAQTLIVPGNPSRVLALEGPLQSLTQLCANRAPAATLFADATGEPFTAQDIEAAVSTSAFDANLDDALQVTPATLRHTYMAFLVRQGLRFSELGKLVGRLPAEALDVLSALAPGTERVGLNAVERTLPALRELNLG